MEKSRNEIPGGIQEEIPEEILEVPKVLQKKFLVKFRKESLEKSLKETLESH